MSTVNMQKHGESNGGNNWPGSICRGAPEHIRSESQRVMQKEKTPGNSQFPGVSWINQWALQDSNL